MSFDFLGDFFGVEDKAIVRIVVLTVAASHENDIVLLPCFWVDAGIEFAAIGAV